MGKGDWSYRAGRKVVTVVPRGYYRRNFFTPAVWIHADRGGLAVLRGQSSWRTVVGFRLGRIQIQFRRRFH